MADELLQQARSQVAAVKAFQGLPRVQRMAANRTPIELRTEILERVSALSAQLATEVVLLKASIETALADPSASKDYATFLASLCASQTAGLAHLDILVSVLRKIGLTIKGPSPDELQAIVFDHLAQEEDEEDEDVGEEDGEEEL